MEAKADGSHQGWIIGVDTGGTFTDCVVATPTQFAIGKALSTPGELWRGIIDSIEDASSPLGGVAEVLPRASFLAHGTTAMLNALLTQRGATVGIITTAGFEDTLAIGRVHQKIAGLAEWQIADVYSLRKSNLFRDKRLIAGVAERIDSQGKVLEPLDLNEVLEVASALRARGASALAVNFLWSCSNPSHEQAAAAAIREAFAGLRVSCSSDLAATVGEYERFATAAVNAYVVDIAADYLEQLQRELRNSGFAGRLLVMRSWGDLERVERVAQNAVPSLFSGPIGGVIGARAASGQAKPSLPTVLCADVGGTSFDVSLIHAGELRWKTNPVVERLHLALPTIDVESIAIGGGSIASRDEWGLLHVGPESAGASPGPACYGRGGLQSTVTDAALVSGWILPSSTMPGGIQLSREAAEQALAQLGEGQTVVSDAALSVLQIACAKMADLLRKASVEGGVDPRTCTPVFYGGAGGQYAAAICEEIGASSFLTPECASAFSAFGMLASGEGLVVSRPLNLTLPVEPGLLRQVFDRLEAEIRTDLGESTSIEFRHYLQMKYAQQINELRVTLASADELDGLDGLFMDSYEQRFGPGTANRTSVVQITSALVHGTRQLIDFRPTSLSMVGDAARKRPSEEHVLHWLDGVKYSCASYSFAAVRAETRAGPAIISDSYTSVVVPPTWVASWREDVNMLQVSQTEQGSDA